MTPNDPGAGPSSGGQSKSSTQSSWSTDSSSAWDDWPRDFDGTGLFERINCAADEPIFRFDVGTVLDEVEQQLGSTVVDIPKVGKGSNYFGMHLRLANGLDVLVRLARCDVNWLRRNVEEISELVRQQAYEVEFEAQVYQLLRAQDRIPTPNLLYCRAAAYKPSAPPTPHRLPPRDTLGRALFLFEKTPGVNNVWPDDTHRRFSILEQCARIRAALFSFPLPPSFVATWLRRAPCPKFLPIDVDIAPTRDFAIAFLAAKIHETIPDRGGFIGWEEDRTTVGPAALRAKQALLRLLPWVMPREADSTHDGREGEGGGRLYRLVFDHGDFGIHNMTITDTEPPAVTSLYDWEMGHIVPALLSDPQISVYVDLELDPEEGEPTISRVWDGISMEERREYEACAEHYFQCLGKESPEYLDVIRAGRDARKIWFTLKSWRGDEPERYFGKLGAWAEDRLSQFVT
ncbi:hypothetical protein MSAN_01156500 [Mycena sanguinolenta]|uniref:Aminoglycoside phosphotransferase domain-containing protein n=1 Tax=Mycena sanguinolenta TaxID=230812 RepID=A0A8H6YLJ5_9AGAR|nr:hypothetical protein MSAN_01156500 [Mycena sanguinolenta]